MSMRSIVKDSVDQSIVIRIIDSTTGLPETAVEHNTAGIDLWYRREGAVQTSITEAALAALDSAHGDGGIEHMGHGYYRLDLPDAAVATGVDGVMIGGTVTDMIVIGCYVPLVGVPEVDLTHIMGTILSEGGAGRLAAAFIKLLDVAAPVLVASDVMRGTDGANTTVPDAAGTAAGLHATTDGKVDAVQGDVTTIAGDVVNIDGAAMRGTDNAALATALATHDTDIKALEPHGTVMRGTDGANTTVPDAAGTAAGLHVTTNGLITNIQSRIPAALVGGRMDSDVGNMQNNVITNSVIATNAIGADEIAAGGVTEIAAGVDVTLTAAHGAGSWAAGAAAPTAVQIRQEMDTNSTQFTAILADSALLEKWLNNRIQFIGTSMILYDNDGVTPLKTWTLSQGTLTVSAPYNRAAAV